MPGCAAEAVSLATIGNTEEFESTPHLHPLHMALSRAAMVALREPAARVWKRNDRLADLWASAAEHDYQPTIYINLSDEVA